MYCCYLLKSTNSETSTATYIGFSVDPQHRLRQHNGEITSGARKTAKYRPWSHVAIVTGFPSHQVALQFEWQWQHPMRSRLKSVGSQPKGTGYKRRLATLSMLIKNPLWSQLDLAIHLFSEEYMTAFVRTLGTGLGSLPNLILSDHHSFETYFKDRSSSLADRSMGDIECSLCVKVDSGARWRTWRCTSCSHWAGHIACLAKVATSTSFSDDNSVAQPAPLIPTRAACPGCGMEQSWAAIVRQSVIKNVKVRAGAVGEVTDGVVDEGAANVYDVEDDSESSGSDMDAEDEGSCVAAGDELLS